MFYSVRKKIGECLMSSGLITPEQLHEALNQKVRPQERLGQALVRLRYITEDKLAYCLSEQLKIPILDERELSYTDVTVHILPRSFIEERQVVPLSVEKSAIRLGMVDPLDFVTIKDVQFLTGKSVIPLVTTTPVVESFLKGCQRHATNVKEAFKKLQPVDHIEVLDHEEEDKEDILSLKKAGEAAPIIGIVNMVLSEAIKLDASDIHVEPREKDLLIRYRVDGLLRDITTLPAHVHLPVISRMKILAKMDIAIHRRPQDGSTKIRMGERDIDLRISTLPTLFGEKMVIRILDRSRKVLSLKDLGILPRDLSTLRTFLSRPQGMVLVTGPTGSGKSTTLYASLLQVKSEGVNVITVEDPVEYRIPGINQVHVNEKAGITFSSGLRSILRQDPNIIMVGEIRDKETAIIAFQSSLTGHLVLSTLHTNNAVSAVTRLIDIGVEPYLVASSVVGVVAQRLVRRNCYHCTERYMPDATVLADLNLNPLDNEVAWYRGKGCEKCHGIGFLGRVGIYEIMRMDDNIRDLIINRASERKILVEARRAGMTTMVEDGLFKATRRITTPEEILRVIPPEELEEGSSDEIRQRISNSMIRGEERTEKAHAENGLDGDSPDKPRPSEEINS